MTDLPMLPDPWDYAYEWDGPYGTRKLSVAPHNGRPPTRTVPVYTAEQVRACIEADRAQRAEPAWIPVSERLPASGVTVLACYMNRVGKLRRIRANWVAAKSIEADTDSEISEYDEATDCYYDPEGWYERIDNWGDYSAVAVCEGDVTHWMPLPEAPPAEPTIACLPDGATKDGYTAARPSVPAEPQR